MAKTETRKITTVVKMGEFKGKKMFEIWDPDATYNKDRSQVSFGPRKASMILDHIKELEKYVEEQGR